MAEFNKKLRYIKDGETFNISLYDGINTNTEVPSLYFKHGQVDGEITLYDNENDVTDGTIPSLYVPLENQVAYAALGDTSDSKASDLRVNYGNTTYAILTQKDSLPTMGKTLNECTWDEISAVAQAGLGANYFNIGDCKEITLNGNIGSAFTANNLTLCVFILGFNHPVNNVADNNIILGGFKTTLTNGMDVALVDSCLNSYATSGTIAFNLNHSYQKSNGSNPGYYGTNYGGWKGTDIRYDILGITSTPPSQYNQLKSSSNIGYDATTNTLMNPKANTLLAALPSDFRNVLRLWTRWIDSVGNSSNTDANVTACIDAGISLLTETEIFGIKQYANIYEYDHNARLAYYTNGNSTVKRAHNSTSTAVDWWESSPSTLNPYTGFCVVESDGTRDCDMGVAYNYGLAPAFKV